MWKKAIPNELDRKRDFAKSPEIKALRLFNMKLPHDFDTKNDEVSPVLTVPAVNYVGIYSPQKAERFLTKRFNLARLLDYQCSL